MRTFFSLASAIVGAFFFSELVSELADAATGAGRSSLLEAGSFSIVFLIILAIIAVIAFFCALRIRGATWAIVLACGVMTALAAFLAFIFHDSRIGIVAASSLVLTFVMHHLGRVRTDASLR